LLDFLENQPNVPYIEAVRVDQLGELLWVSKVLLLALERINKNIDFL